MPQIEIGNLGEVGVVKDITAHKLPRNAWSDSNSLRFTTDGAEVLRSQKSVFTTATFNPTWIRAFPPRTNPLWVYGDDSRLYCYEEGIGHTNISQGGGTPYLAGGERWQGAVFQGVGIFNQGNDAPQLWSPMTGATALVTLTGWSTNPETNCRTFALRPYRNFLIALRIRAAADSTWTKPFRVRWSDAAEPGSVPTTWLAAPENSAGEFDLAETDDYVVDGLALGDIFIVYKEKTTWGMQIVEGEGIMKPWRILDESGILYRDCVCPYPGGHLVCTGNDIISHTGQVGASQSVLENRLRKWLFSVLDIVRFKQCFMVPNIPRKEIWFYFPSSGAIYANKVLMWSWVTGTVGTMDVEETPFASAGPVITSLGGTDTWTSGF